MSNTRRHFERWLQRRADRRQLMKGSVGLAATLSLAGRPTRAAFAATSRTVNTTPFTLGVASGDPLSDGVVLWTRLATDPLDESGSGGMSPDPVEVRWEIARDDGFRDVVQSGAETATAEFGHSVHVDASGLEPGRDYFYRFLAAGEISPTGRTKTSPPTGELADRLRFGFASCAHWEHGYFAAYREMAREALDLVLFQGDYIYEYGPNDDYQSEENAPIRLFAGTGPAETLAGYRLRHGQYKTDSDLQAAHASAPWIATWDDHEVVNDYAGGAETDDAFLARRAAAYQVYYEHMPLRPTSMPRGPELQLYRRLRYGSLADISVLDTRQYRSRQPCGDAIVPRCDAVFDPALTMTGPEQERWLLDGLDASAARWKIISQQTMMAELAVKIFPPDIYYSDDQWDGYPLARERILTHIVEAGIENAVVLSGDIHSAWVNDLRTDYTDPASPTIATEFICPSVTATNPVGGRLALILASNPHVKFLDLRHGYTLCDLSPTEWRTDFRAFRSVDTPDAAFETIASFVVESGRAGAVPA